MHPQIFGSATFGVFIALAVAIGTITHLLLVHRTGLPVRRVLLLYAGTGLLLFIGARIFSILLDADPGSSRWLAARFRYPGAVLALLVALPVLGRLLARGIPLRCWGDLMVPGAGFALATLRVDCFLAGCCAGRASHLPWAVSFPRGSSAWYAQVMEGGIPVTAAVTAPLHPLQLYFLLLSLGAGLLALAWLPRKSYDGQVVLLFLLLHEGGKALLELLRQPPLPEVQAASAGVAVAAGLALAAIWSRGRLQARLEAA